MKSFLHFAFVVGVLTCMVAVAGCGGEEGQLIAFTRVEHKDGYRNHYLTLTELRGPVGSTVEAPLWGTYTAKGTYDVTGTRMEGAVLRIRLSMEWAQSQGEVTEFTTTVPSGTYEVTATFYDEFAVDVPPGPSIAFDPRWIRVEMLIPGTWADWITPVNDGALDVDSMIVQVTPACSGQGVPGTAAYTAGIPGIHPVLIVPDPNVPSWKDELKTEWIPPTVAQCQLVVCCDYDWDRLGTCTYTGGRTLHRTKPKVHVKLREALTGNLVAETTLYGKAPGSCPSSATFSSHSQSMTGEKPTCAQLEDWLRPYVEP